MERPLDTVIDLQKALDELREAEERLHGIPAWMRELHDEHATRKAEIDVLVEAVEEAAGERRAAVAETQDSQEKLRNYQDQISRVRNQREYGALLKEIDAIKGTIKSLEEQGLAALERQDASQTALDELKESFRELDERYGTELEKWEAEKPSVAKQVQGLKGRITVLRERIPPASLSLFERVLERHSGDALAEVHKLERVGRGQQVWSCGACNYRVRPQAIVEISNNGSIVFCDSCNASSSSQRSPAEASAEPAMIAERLAAIEQRIAAACQRSNRRSDEVTLLGAAKRQPLDKIRAARDAGLKVVGENRVQEAEQKQPELPGLEWHLIGPLQSNKAKKAVRLFSAVHSLDRPKIARVLAREAAAIDRELLGFLEVNLGREESKHGFDPDEVVAKAKTLAALGSLKIVGLMAIPPYETDAEAARRWFRRLRELRDELCSTTELASCPGWLSMGMSSDFEVAIEEGATHVRIGTALFGPRPA